MIDFTNLPVRNKTYAGANGNKISIVYNDEIYMLKFPPYPTKTKEMSYTNGCISEYIGCHIYESIGIPVQETLLGIYTKNGRDRIVCACKDFTVNGLVLQDFASLKNTIIDSARNGYGTEIDDIIDTINEQTAIDQGILTERFWDMFIVDALIGNWDRHNGNWGFLYNSITDELSLAPVYDCGSCLYPQADEDLMYKILNNQAERDFRIYDIPLSAIKQNNKKIRYFDFLNSGQYKECDDALKRIVPKIDIACICQFIDEISYISPLQKKFYKEMLSDRKKRILDCVYEKICFQEWEKTEVWNRRHQ